MLQYSHLGIPTTEKKPGERYLPDFKMWVSGYESSRFKIEWMRFEPGCPLPELVQRVPNIDFIVDDLAQAIQGCRVIIPPNSPSAGVNVAFIDDNGAPVELMQVDPGAQI
jgi:hypothetical protein